jgi:large subunit ribosomal protein L5
MSVPRITKVCVNIGVGEGGDRLVNAENVLEIVTGVRPQRTLGRIQNRDLKVREGAPIGCRSTMRNKESINEFLKNAFWVRDNTIPSWNFDAQGNLSFRCP